MATTPYRQITLDEIPRGADGRLLEDLYVFLPVQKSHIIFLRRGEVVPEAKLDLIRRRREILHLYLQDPVHGDISLPGSTSPTPVHPSEPKGKTIPETMLGSGVLGQELIGLLRFSFQKLMDPTWQEVSHITERLFKVSEELLQALAPDTAHLRTHMLQNAKSLSLMNDSAAITTLAFLTAFANGNNTRQTYRDLALACLFMDLPLMGIDDETWTYYYAKREELPEYVMAKFMEHPGKAHHVASDRIKTVNDTTLSLILYHHELNNGAGYPKKAHTDSLTPAVKQLAFAVDLFEHLKKAEINGEAVDLIALAKKFHDPHVAPHECRHKPKLVEHVIDFLVRGERLEDQSQPKP